MLLVEKYRPQVLEEVVGFDPTTFAIDETLPHLLFYGPPGTGKTSLAKVIIKQLACDSITLNASVDRGIDIIRQKVKDFASTQSSNKNIKIIFLDECDQLTNDAQTALRNTMETYAGTCRFVLTANQYSKIIDPIKSRCISVEFNHIPKDKIVERLEYICQQEKIPYEKAALVKIVERNNSDMRRSVNKLEELKEGVKLDRLKNETKLAEEVFKLIKAKDFVKARQLMLDQHAEPEVFMQDLYQVIWESTEPQTYKQKAILEITDAYKWLSSVAWPQILQESLVLKLME